MDPSDAVQILTIVILLLLSAFFSSAETALTTVNKLKMRALSEDGSKRAKTVLKLIEDPHKMLSTILICNNIVNLSASSIATAYAINLCNELGLGANSGLGAGIATGILTFLILVFGEITPKTMATQNAEKISLSYASAVIFITALFTPITFIISKISDFILFILRVDTSSDKRITEDELRTFVDVSHEEGVIESEEHQMITNIVDFGDSLAKDVMIPRLDIEMVSMTSTYAEVLSAFTENKYARMPVYDDSIDNIVGIINMKDFVFFKGSKESFELKNIMREPHFTYEYKRTAELFLEMRNDFVTMEIVLDEYGALAGLITMEDLLEEIVGDIRDEYDTDEEDEIQAINENEYVLQGTAPLDDIAEELGLPIEAEDYDSISGHVINLLDHFPDQGEQVEDNYAVYTVLEVDKNRIDKIHLLLKPQPEEEE